MDEIIAKGGHAEVSYGDDEMIRKAGTGPYRLRKPIQMRDDLYSMIFATCFHPEYVKDAEDAKSKKDDLLDEIIKDFKEQGKKR